MIDGWITGVDVSRAQRPSACDWDRAKAARVRFAFVKLSEGADYIDDAAHEHLANIAASGIPVGVYHVGRPDNRFRLDTSDGRKAGEIEAAWTVKCMRDRRVCEKVSLLPAIDLEKYAEGVTAKQRGEYVRALVRGVAEHLGRPPIIYCGDKWWKYQVPPGMAAEMRAMGCPLWLVAYSKEPEPPAKEAIKHWPWTLWQYSGGRQWAYAPPIDGLPKPIDVNRYRGTLLEFNGLRLAA